MRVWVEEIDRTARVRVAGHITTSDCGGIASALQGISGTHDRLILDLSSANADDATKLDVLIALERELDERGSRTLLSSTVGPVRLSLPLGG